MLHRKLVRNIWHFLGLFNEFYILHAKKRQIWRHYKNWKFSPSNWRQHSLFDFKNQYIRNDTAWNIILLYILITISYWPIFLPDFQKNTKSNLYSSIRMCSAVCLWIVRTNLNDSRELVKSSFYWNKCERTFNSARKYLKLVENTWTSFGSL